jgi:type I restriction enzyme M protein
MPANHTELEKRLWGAADELRANSKLKSSEYSVPVLGLIFLRYADFKFAQAKVKLTSQGTGRRTIGKADYQARGVLYLPEPARFANLLQLPEGADIGRAIDDAMKAIEADNEDLKGVLPRTYGRLDKELLVSLLKNFAAIPMDIEGDAFGRIYEYFLGKFAMSEGPEGRRVLHAHQHRQADCGDHRAVPRPRLRPGLRILGMFVQSAAFVERHKKNPTSELSIYGHEKTEETIRLCKKQLTEEELVIFDLLTKPANGSHEAGDGGCQKGGKSAS